MKFAICNETFCDWPLDKATQYAAAAGYTGWEVAPFMLTDDLSSYSQKQRVDYRTVVEDAGLHMVGLHWLLAKTEGLHLTTGDEPTRRDGPLREIVRVLRGRARGAA